MKVFIAVLIIPIAVLSTVAFSTNQTSAADARQYNPGRIIDDAVFTNSNSMSVQDIQNFFNSKVACDTWGTKTSELGEGTRRQWMANRGITPPFRCVTDYYENPSNGQSNYSKNDIPAGAISAAQIIYNYSKQYNINPQSIIATLQKENGMITDEWPTPKQFTEAMGFGCPDNVAPGAPACDPAYKSFATQVYQASRHFRGYMDNQYCTPSWCTTHRVGQDTLKWNPNSACGTSTINIENKATSALYSYTPYRPNDAALNAQYGKGNDCSAYGNRNFYLYFTDWFGSTHINGTFLRTVDNGTLYLIVGNIKYPIADINTYIALSPIGGVGYVSQAYLNSLTTGSLMGRVIRSSNGTVYFYDAGIKLPFNSCTQVEAYGSTCAQSILLEDYQINKLANGPAMSSLFGTTSGKLFSISDGKKSEVYDRDSLSQQAVNEGYNILNESALSNLTYGAPVIRNDVFVKDRSNSKLYVYADNALASINASIEASSYLSSVNAPKLDTESLLKLPKSIELTGYIKALDGTSYIITNSGKVQLSNPLEWSDNFQVVSSGILSQIPTVANLAAPYTVKANGAGGTVYLLDNRTKRAITSWGDMNVLTPAINIITTPDYYLNNFSTGDLVLSPGALVKTPDNPTVYMVDGLRNKIVMTSFNPSSELGLNTLKIVPTDVLNRYITNSGQLSAAVQCGAQKGLAINGSVYTLNLSYAPYSSFTDINCKLFNWNATPSFLLAPSGTIYQLKDSKKLPIGGYDTYLNLGGNQSNTIKSSYYILDYIQTGNSL